MKYNEYKEYVARATTEDLEKEISRVRADVKEEKTTVVEGLLKVCIIENELLQRDTVTG